MNDRVRIPSDELSPPVLEIRRSIPANTRQIVDVGDLRTLWLAHIAADGLTLAFGDGGPDLPLTGAAGAGSGTNFIRLPSGVRRLIVANTTGAPIFIHWFYSSGRDFFVTLSQSSPT
jgi:hypothetical protein